MPAVAIGIPVIRRLDDPSALVRMEIDHGLGAFCRYGHHREAFVRQTLGKVLRTPEAEVFVALGANVIVGYLLNAPAGRDEPWGRIGYGRVLETGVEVSRAYRGQGVARALFTAAFSRPLVESRIHVATAYLWCWDLADSGLSASAYAGRLLRLFERFGFHREWTNEPNVAMEPVNFLAVRIGRLVSPDLVRRFRRVQRGELAA
jgi:GNAT superfamily N-acetyltransferase